MVKLNSKIAVLLICFNRPDEFLISFSKIVEFYPKKIFIHIDGPRNKSDHNKINEIKNHILKSKEECNIYEQKNNLGCKSAVQFALNWFYNNVDYGLIIEDDILVYDNFIKLANFSYQNHKDKIFCGYNQNINENYSKLYLCDKLHVWGWGCSKNIFRNYQNNLPSLNEIHFVLNKKFNLSIHYFFYYLMLRCIKKQKINTWDYQLQFFIFKHNIKTILPPFPIVRNIGFNNNSTHTSKKPLRYVDAKNYINKKISFNLNVIKVEHKNFLKIKFIDLMYLIYKNIL